jgi:Squalene-hopene cyclase C-terminal domain
VPAGEGFVADAGKRPNVLLPNSAAYDVLAAEARPKGQPGIPFEPPGSRVGEARQARRTDIPLDVQARQAAERAIPYIEREGAAWIRERQCLACHYAGYMLWSLHDAELRGFALDRGKLAESTRWAMNQPSMDTTGNEGAAQIIIARDRSDRSADTMERVEALRDLIVQNQRKDGSWSPGGQLPAQKRPLSETKQVSTMLCVLALDSLDELNEAGKKTRDKALTWLKNTPPNGTTPAVSSEWYAMRLLIEKKFGDPKQVEALRDQVLSAQRPDGGWGWLWADAGDAFGTGVSLYALSNVGLTHSHPAIQKAWKFLAETQTDDGSWIVNGTKTGTKGKPHALSSFWGATWALLGLSHSLPALSTDGSQSHPAGS